MSALVDLSQLSLKEADLVVQKELKPLGLAIEAAGVGRPNFRSQYDGWLFFSRDNMPVRFVRGHKVWHVNTRKDQTLPKEKAEAIQCLFGNEVRPIGNLFTSNAERDGISSWEVDSLEGLTLLTTALRQHYSAAQNTAA